MGIFDDKDEDKEIDTEVVDNEKIHLREEELDVAKDKVETGAVNLRKEVVEEKKEVDVPVTHEEVIIERRAMHEPSDEPISNDEEMIHIPVTEEQVEVGKHTIVTGEITAHKRAVEETKHIEETLKREEARIDSEGDANIVADEHLE
jgi:uncharacterized protein (TIGR02271 family)